MLYYTVVGRVSMTTEWKSTRNFFVKRGPVVMALNRSYAGIEIVLKTL